MARTPTVRIPRTGYQTWLIAQYNEYMIREADDGGSCTEWTTEINRLITADPETGGFNKFLLEMNSLACQSVWRKDPVPAQGSLFEVAGIITLPSYTFPDQIAGHGFRRVFGRYAAVHHVEDDAQIKVQKAAEATEASVLAVEHAARIRAEANGDRYAMLWDLRTERLISASPEAHAPPPP